MHSLVMAVHGAVESGSFFVSHRTEKTLDPESVLGNSCLMLMKIMSTNYEGRTRGGSVPLHNQAAFLLCLPLPSALGAQLPFCAM